MGINGWSFSLYFMGCITFLLESSWCCISYFYFKLSCFMVIRFYECGLITYKKWPSFWQEVKELFDNKKRLIAIIIAAILITTN